MLTEEKRKSIESQQGARYSSLYKLPYYNAISSCVVDPMHCYFLEYQKDSLVYWYQKRFY